MTTEELAKRLFPKKVRDKLKAVAHEKDGENQVGHDSCFIAILVPS